MAIPLGNKNQVGGKQESEGREATLRKRSQVWAGGCPKMCFHAILMNGSNLNPIMFIIISFVARIERSAFVSSRIACRNDASGSNLINPTKIFF